MKVKVTEDNVVITECSCINEGEVGINESIFVLPECFEGLSVTAAFNNIPVPIIENKCCVPSLKKGTAILGVYAYKENDEGIELMYSPKPTSFFVNQGSYSDECGVEKIPTISEFEQLCRKYHDEIVKELKNVDNYFSKVTEINESSTDEQIPSAKAVYELFSGYEPSVGTTSGGGLNSTAINLLIQILQEGIYSTNVSGKIGQLQTALAQGGTGGSGGTGDSGDSGGADTPTITDDITVTDGVMTIISVGSEISVTDSVMTIL